MFEAVFQKFCVETGEPGRWISSEAAKTFPIIRTGYCSQCGVPFHSSRLIHVCFHCASKAPAYDKHRAPFIYEGPVQKLVQDFKYKGEFWVRQFYKEFVSVMAEEFDDIDVVVPVPLHINRLKERGFNQSQLLAEIWSQVLKKPMVPAALERVVDTPSQTTLTKAERLINLKNVFALNDAVDIKGKRVLLVDDVHTTGATFDVAAKILKDAGAESVMATSFAIVPERKEKNATT